MHDKFKLGEHSMQLTHTHKKQGFNDTIKPQNG